MTRKLGWILFVMALGATASAQSGKISGYVRSATGVPQMGATVEVAAGANIPAQTAYTNNQGFFVLSGLLPGRYNVKVSAPAFLPTLRENINLHTGSSLVLNFTLNTLFEAISLFPERKQPTDDQDDWKWTLRSTSSRPVLRVVNGGAVVVAQQERDPLRARVSFIAGSQSAGFGAGSGYGTDFQVEQSLFATGTLSFAGNLAYSDGMPGGTFRAAYSRELGNGAHPEFGVTVRRLGSSGLAPRSETLQSVETSASNRMQLTSSMEMQYGAAFQSIQFAGRHSAVRPFATLDWHLTPNTLLEYRFATSLPSTRELKGFDTSPRDLTEANPRVTLEGDRGQVEKASHHEISLSRRIGRNSMQIAFFNDRISDVALTGVGIPDAVLSGMLPDIFSGTFSYNGGSLSTRGLRIVFERKLPGEVTATFDYAFGGVLDMDGHNLAWDEVRSMLQTTDAHEIAAKVAGTLPAAGTRWIASYGWTSVPGLTSVDAFNASPGQADPYLSIFVRQPLPRSRFVPGKVDAVIDVRNLLAQGYVPVLASDGNTVYLVQSARSVRGGVAFTF